MVILLNNLPPFVWTCRKTGILGTKFKKMSGEREEAATEIESSD